jgi:nitrous oxide reductase accessory protein NosL
MFVARYPDWVAGVVFEDGRAAWFDGAKDLFKFLLGPERYAPSRRAADVARAWVTDYYGLTLLDAREAWFVIGSDVYGPMGSELVPFAREEDAREFKADHKGTALLRFGDVGPATLRQLQEPE